MVDRPFDGETLLGVSSVYLFGRPMADLILRKGKIYEGLGVASFGENNFLRVQLQNNAAQLARVFSFSFEGAFFELSRPSIFLVHGDGLATDWPDPTNSDGDIEYDRLSRSPGSSARTGLGAQVGAFARGMRVWIYDKCDVSMRLDIETGPLEQILLSSEASGESRGVTGSVMARSSGGMARSSGVMARSSGWNRKGDFD